MVDPIKREKRLARRRLSNRAYRYKSRFGITYEDYIDMSYERRNLCDICRVDATNTQRGKLSIDHDHESGRIKGLLCQECNTGLGLMKESPKNLFAAFFYIIRFRIKSNCLDLKGRLYGFIKCINWPSNWDFR